MMKDCLRNHWSRMPLTLSESQCIHPVFFCVISYLGGGGGSRISQHGHIDIIVTLNCGPFDKCIRYL